MAIRGKEHCEIMRELRLQIAELNNIEYNPEVCTFEGDCIGHCPKCDEETKILNDALLCKKRAGETIVWPNFDVFMLNRAVIDDEELGVSTNGRLMGMVDTIAVAESILRKDIKKRKKALNANRSWWKRLFQRRGK